MSKKLDEGRIRLKVGFQFSLITDIIFAMFIICFYFLPFLWFVYLLILIFCIISYVISVYERSKGWHLLNHSIVSVIIILGGLTILLSPFTYLLTFSFWMYCWILPIAWGTYTIFESYGFTKLKQTYNVNLLKSIISNLLGVSVLVLAELIILNLFAFNYILTPFLLASPFLVASCMFTMSELKKSGGTRGIVTEKGMRALVEAHKAKFALVAGVLEIILASTSMFVSSYYLLVIMVMFGLVNIFGLMMFGLVASIFGLIGGIFAFKRKRFRLAFVGCFLITCWGVGIGLFALSPFQIFIVLFSIIILTFLLASKTEYT